MAALHPLMTLTALTLMVFSTVFIKMMVETMEESKEGAEEDE